MKDSRRGSTEPMHTHTRAQYVIAVRQPIVYLWHILPLHFGLFQCLVGILKVSQAPQTAVEQPKGRLAVSIIVPQEICQLQVLVRGDAALKLLHRWGELPKTSQTLSGRHEYCKLWCMWQVFSTFPHPQLLHRVSKLSVDPGQGRRMLVTLHTQVDTARHTTTWSVISLLCVWVLRP